MVAARKDRPGAQRRDRRPQAVRRGDLPKGRRLSRKCVAVGPVQRRFVSTGSTAVPMSLPCGPVTGRPFAAGWSRAGAFSPGEPVLTAKRRASRNKASMPAPELALD